MSSGYNAKSSLKELKLVAVALMMDMAMDIISKVQTSQKCQRYQISINSFIYELSGFYLLHVLLIVGNAEPLLQVLKDKLKEKLPVKKSRIILKERQR